jgi:predicted ATPase
LEVAGRFVAGPSATQVAFPDGVFFVELAALSSVEQMITAVATTLGFAIEREIEPLHQILNFLSNKQLLLLLDNFEHLLAPSVNGAEVVTAVLQAAPAVKIIITSRQKLNLSSEVLFVLEGLAFPDWQTTAGALSYSAVQLFLQSAQRVRYDFTLEDTALSHVARICRLTEGMPLGIVLAAAWIELLSLAEIADEMQADIDFLASEMGDLPPRQRSMRAVFDYSWASLTEPEQQVLAKLSVFRGGFTREAAQAVTGAMLRQLLALVNKSLIQRDVGSGRFTLHELLRQLAAEKLETKGETNTIYTAHSHYYLSWLAGRKDDLHKYKQLEIAHMLRRDEQNILTAWLWAAEQGEAGLLLSVMQPFPDYIMMTGREFDAMRLYKRTLQLLPPGDITFTDTADDVTFARASLLNHLQDMGFDQDGKGQTIDIDRLHAFFQARGAKLEEALVCQHLAYRSTRAQNFPQALAYFQKQTDLYEQENEVFRLPLSLSRVALLVLFAGQIEEAFTLFQRAASVSEQYGDPLFGLTRLYLLALYSLFDKIDYPMAKQQFAEISAWSHQLWLDGLNAINLFGSMIFQGLITLMQGELAEAQQLSQEMYEIAAVRNNPNDKLRADSFEGLIRATTGQYKTVNVPALEAREGDVLLIGPIGMALTAYGKGNHHVAITMIVQAWSVPITMRWPAILLQYMPIVASLLADQGEFSRAAALLAMGRTHPACPHGWWEIMVLLQELEARLQTELSPEEYAAAQARGREMDVRETAVSLLEELKAMAA